MKSGRLNVQGESIDILFLTAEKWNADAVFTFINTSLMLDMLNGVLQWAPTVQFAVSVEDFWARMRRIEKKLKDGEWRVVHKKVTFVEDIPEANVRVLCGFPGFGPALAKRVLGQYGSLGKAMEAGPERWAEDVKGVGPDRAMKVKVEMERRWGDGA